MTNETVTFHTYTRAEALADGVLVDVTEAAREVGFLAPVAVTAAVWAGCVAAPPGVGSHDKRGRHWDVLWVLLAALRSGRGSAGEVRFRLDRLDVMNDIRDGASTLAELKAACGPADDGSPCVTVMLPEED